ncbi:hypothetical protein [Streptomyces sp. NRRL F-4474]|uniref:hypothetical protein n=1 Tax=Streptomyces sp. NRRL F-4474 TaxID=1463851 RepID=UPI0004C5F7DA|nr:hypothetical protein [Streptomyces sp. NRRL F-4474]
MSSSIRHLVQEHGCQSTYRAYARLIVFRTYVRTFRPALRPTTFYSADGNAKGQLDWFTPAGIAPGGACKGSAHARRARSERAPNTREG